MLRAGVCLLLLLISTYISINNFKHLDYSMLNRLLNLLCNRFVRVLLINKMNITSKLINKLTPNNKQRKYKKESSKIA
jgi:hypothetical protein